MMVRMLRRHATTVVLCLLAVVLVVGVLVDRGSVTTDEAEQGRGRLFVAWREADLSELRVTAPGGSYRLAREESDSPDEPGAWRMLQDEQPIDADQQEVGQLLAALELGRYERQVDAEGLGASSLGLDGSARRFELTMGELGYVLLVGAEAPSPAGGHYAAIEGAGQPRRVVVIGSALVEALSVNPSALRARELLPYPSTSIQRLVLVDDVGAVQWSIEQARGSAGHRVQIRRDGPWVRADRRSVTGLLVGLAQLEVQRFVSQPSPPGRDAARLALELTLVDASASKARLEVHGPCPEGPGRLLVRRTPSLVQACVAERAAQTLQVPADKLIDRFVVGAAPSSIVELKLTSDEQTVEVARKGEGWHMRSPQGGTADDKAVDGWLEGLLQVRGTILTAAQAEDREALGLTAPRATARVVSLAGQRGSDGRGERLERFEVGAAKDGAFYVRRLEDDAILRVAEDSGSALLPRATAMRSTALVQLAARRFRTLDIRAGGLHQRMERAAEGGWTLREPQNAGLAADPTLVGQLVERLSKLRAVRWVADRPVPAHGLSEPSGVIDAKLAPDQRADHRNPDAGPAAPNVLGLRLVLGAEAPDGIYAQHDDDPGVFLLDRSVADLARRWLLDRAALMVQPRSVARVVLAGPDPERPLSVEHEGEHWRVVEGQPATVATALLVRDTLRDLLAEGVVQVGPAPAREGFAVPVLTLTVEHNDEVPGLPSSLVLRVGTGDVWHNTSVFYVRRGGVDATYAVAQARLQPLVQLVSAQGTNRP